MALPFFSWLTPSKPDQYVLPGTIIYKQRGTIWHPGENTILGRDHTIHSAVAGYVKYYRDAKRHPDRQYIGVALDRDDMLPQSYDAIRKRRLGMVAVTRKAVAITDTFSKSGIPQRVIRKEGVIEHGGLELATSRDAATTEAAVEAAESAAREATNGSRELGGNETRAKRAARRWNTYIRIKRSNRMLFLRKDYSYSESNFQIGRLMGKHKGKTPGTQRYGSRRSLLRHRRQKREERLRQMKEMERQVAQERTPRAGKAASKAVGKKPPQKTRGAKKTAS